MTTPRKDLLFHFTHVSNLATIAQDGLHCDSNVTAAGRSITEVGDQKIKSRRRCRIVPISPGGVVADYVPFYFAERSPMLYAIHMNNVKTYSGGQDEVVYLVTTVDAVVEHKLAFVFTNRNAVLSIARYGNNLADLDSYVDWPLMQSQWFKNTPEEPDRRERRMAELLVHRHVPWSAIIGVAAKTEKLRRQTLTTLATVGVTTPVKIKSGWYF